MCDVVNMYTYSICVNTCIVYIICESYVCVQTHTHTHFMVSPKTKFSSGNLNPAKSLSVGFLPPETKPSIPVTLHSIRNLEKEYRLSCCFAAEALSCKYSSLKNVGNSGPNSQQCSPPPIQRLCWHKWTSPNDRSTLPLELMDLSNTLFHAFCF